MRNTRYTYIFAFRLITLKFLWGMGIVSIFLENLVVHSSFLPFTDITPGDPYYDSVRVLYQGGVITDTPDHLFRPREYIRRDAFTSLVLGASCNACLFPTVENILEYRSDPFPDITEKNRYFYCISQAKKENIVVGYNPDPNTQVSRCQNGLTSTVSTFCPENTTSRIEAVAMLLREARLWNDTQNSRIIRTIDFPDVSEYWYGYTKKGIEAGLIRVALDGKVHPDDPITHGEFAIMAVKTMRLNQCNNLATQNAGNSIPVAINIQNGKDFLANVGNPEGTGDDINRKLGYKWNFYNTDTQEQFRRNEKDNKNISLGNGKWIVTLDVYEGLGNTGSSIQSVIIGKNEGGNISSIITASTLTPKVGERVDFEAKIIGGTTPYEIHWNFGDGTQSTEKNVKHTFNTPGSYPIHFMVRDKEGKVSTSKIVIAVGSKEDSDLDGIPNANDRCPLVAGPPENQGCPLLPGVSPEDKEKKNPDWHDTLLDGLEGKNVCLAKRVENTEAISHTPMCESCPCEFSLDGGNPLEACDIIFPVILSPDKKGIYSRGSTYQIQ